MKVFTKTLLLLLLFSACKETKQSREAMLPESAGQLAEIVVITDKQSLDSSYKELVKSVFQADLKGFPPPSEPQFKVLFTDEGFFKGYFQSHQNIYVLVTADNIDALSKIIGEGNLPKVREVINNQPDVLGFNRSNIWAQNQNVFYVTGKNNEDIKSKIINRKKELLDLAHKNEVTTAEKKFFVINQSADSFYQKRMAMNGFSVRKPKSYRLAVDESDFTWLRKSPSDKEQEFGIILFEVPYTSKEQLTTNNLIAIRNTFTQKYVPGSIEGSYMKYSDAITPHREEFNLDGSLAIEIRGWWDVQGDFMGGPSVIRAVVDEKNNRIVFVEGFLYFPNEKKARSLRELELIINTLEIK